MCTLTAVSESIDASNESLNYRIARTPADRLGAFRLVYRSYLRAGLEVPNPHAMRITPHQLCPTSQVFVGVIRSEVVSTVTLVGDGALQLPMETMFAQEVSELRAQGRRMAEVSCLADRRQEPRRFLNAFSELTRLMAQFARYEGITNLMISVHPRHTRFYTRYLGFLPVSDRVAECPHVQDRPAVALQLDFDYIDRHRPACYDQFFGVWVPREELLPYTLEPEEHRRLALLAQSINGQESAKAMSHEHAVYA